MYRYTILPAAQKKNLELILDVDPQTPDKIMGDMLRLKQILINLLNNAVKVYFFVFKKQLFILTKITLYSLLILGILWSLFLGQKFSVQMSGKYLSP